MSDLLHQLQPDGTQAQSDVIGHILEQIAVKSDAHSVHQSFRCKIHMLRMVTSPKYTSVQGPLSRKQKLDTNGADMNTCDAEVTVKNTHKSKADVNTCDAEVEVNNTHKSKEADVNTCDAEVEVNNTHKSKMEIDSANHHCDDNCCGTVLIFDADQKLTRKKCSSKVGCKILTVEDSNFKLEAKTGSIESPMQTSKMYLLAEIRRVVKAVTMVVQEYLSGMMMRKKKSKKTISILWIFQSRLSRQILTKHRDNDEVKAAKQLPVKDRNQVLCNLKRRGYHQYNLMLMKEEDFDVNQIVKERQARKQRAEKYNEVHEDDSKSFLLF
ncbi:unnamed protein product [Mytilus edulis]|uniref:Uncharacterized protein n=1 Tax=Mytilus edulis TaxID=6550 RepID=A0A8S3VBL7_MYTED|nr:unnamed protein product [Mytilus edulis]